MDPHRIIQHQEGYNDVTVRFAPQDVKSNHMFLSRMQEIEGNDMKVKERKKI